MNILLTLLLLLTLMGSTACSVDTETAAGTYKQSLQQEGQPQGATAASSDASDGGDESDSESEDGEDGEESEEDGEEAVDPEVAAAQRLMALAQAAKPVYDGTCGVAGCHGPVGMSTLNARDPALAPMQFQNIAIHANANVTPLNADQWEGMIEYLTNPF